MLEIFDNLRELNMASFVLRISLAVLFGGFIGITRGKKNKSAGFRTYMLVSLGAALAMLMNQYLNIMFSTQWGSTVESLGITMDMSRLAAQVVSGIGFLGIGIVFVTGFGKVEGLTTAAGLWSCACMGIAIGVGFYECVIISFFLILISITIFAKVESHVIELSQNLIMHIEFYEFSALKEIIKTIKKNNITMYDLNIQLGDSKKTINSSATIYMNLKNSDIKHSYIISEISDLEGVHRIEEI